MEINFLEIMMASEKGKIIVQQFITTTACGPNSIDVGFNG
jgi:hypothetical protein